MLAYSLRMALLKLNRAEGTKDKVAKGLSALRNFMGMIKKGMIYSPSHGLLAFTVPQFDEYVKRVMSAQ